MKIGILSQWFDPEPGPAALPGVLARSLAARGHEVQVVTGFPNYPDGRIADGYKQRRKSDEVDGGLRVRRVALFPSHSASITGRLANYGSFAVSALTSGVGVLKDMDAVWVSNDPVTVGLPMQRIARSFRVPMLLHVIDLWPDNIFSSGLVGNQTLARTMARGVHLWNRSMYERSSHVAGISPGIVRLLAQRGVSRDKLHHIPLWANERAFYPAAPGPLREEFRVAGDRVVILYAGTLGRTQAIDTLLAACAAYSETAPQVECWIAGSGVEEQELRQRSQSLSHPRVTVRFLGRIDTSDMTSLMAAADVHYVGLRDDANSTVTMPSKIQATMASAKPMIIAVPGDATDVVMGAHAGFRADPGSADTVAQAMAEAAAMGRDGLAAMGRASRVGYDARFSLASGTDRIEALLASAAAERAR